MFKSLFQYFLARFVIKPKRFTDLKEEVLYFLRKTDPKLCVMATVGPGKPQCAVMGYAVLSDLFLVLSTDNFSRKWKNLQKNKNVAINFGWSFSTLNVQYEGIATLVDKKSKDFKRCEEIYMASHPESLEYKDLPSMVYLEISPTWFRLSDYLVDPPRIVEKTF
jgi:general stress protein 26